MKARIWGILSLVSLIAGCELSEVNSWGDKCPPEGAENARLAYIGTLECRADNVEACDTSEMVNKDIRVYFNTNNCPAEYRKCEEMEQPGSYYCAKDEKTVIVKECAQGKPCEKADGQVFCLDDSNSETCGATDCNADAPTYGGVNCKLIRASCEKVDGKYACVNQENGNLACDNIEISPADIATCGANDCSKENYGGVNCDEVFGEGAICSKSKENSTYQCVCRSSYVMCDGKCVYAKTDKNHCGAKGECSDADAGSENYRGAACNIDESEGGCRDGVCGCFGNKVLCVIDGGSDDEPQCYSPTDDMTCGVKLSEDGVHCAFEDCGKNHQCRMETSTSYYCELVSCDDDEQLCYENGESKCYSNNDVHHCGRCNIDCDVSNFNAVQATECKTDDRGKLSCAYRCNDGLMNCGSEFSPLCVDVKSSSANCGGCGKACPGNSYCENGECIATDCQNTECTTKNSSGMNICVNLDDKCGKDCVNCGNVHANAHCLNGACIFSACNAGEHPIFNSNAQIVQCEVNTASKCAPSDIKAGDVVKDCSKEYTQNVKTTSCTNAGGCVISECNAGYHLNSDKTKCVANSETACAAVNSSNAVSCIKGSISSADCSSGKCVVKSCNSGYHINSAKTGCDANSKDSCAAVNSSDARSCMTSNVSNAECSSGKCVVKSCNSGYHLNSTKTECVANSNTACAAVDSSDVKTCMTSNVSNAECSSGKCVVKSCNSGYHLNSTKTECVANSNTACAAVDSSDAKTCMASNVSNAECSSGKCVVKSCNSGYHLNSTKTGGVANSNTACAAVDSSDAKTCMASNVSSAECSGGKCVVKSCNSSYHLNSAKTGCDANSNTACGSTTETGKDCTKNAYEKVCKKSAGVCACSENDSTVLNYDRNACVDKVCKGIPGVLAGGVNDKNYFSPNYYSDYSCKPTQCNAGYSLQTQSTGAICRPLKASYDCTKYGYAKPIDSWDVCSVSGSGDCASTHKFYIDGCLPVDSCCGTKTDRSSALYFQCTNCSAKGQKCNVSTGSCY